MDAFYAGGGIGLGPRPVELAPERYPPPLVTSRDGVQGPTKTAVAGLVRLAEGHGWTVQVTYAKGYVQHAGTGKPSAQPRESLAVRMERAGHRAVAIYVDHGATWSWDTLLLLDGATHRFTQVGKLKERLI